METYIVQPGDTLSKLSVLLLGSGASWQDLWNYNPQIQNPDLIQVGEPVYYPKAILAHGPIEPIKWKVPMNTVLIGMAAAIAIGALAFTKPKRS